MKAKLISIDISEITEKLKLINGKMSEELILKLNELSILLPDFDTYDFDMVQVPIVEKPEILINLFIHRLIQYLLKL